MRSETYSAARLALGTAQFGLNYGIANRAGQISLSEAKKILEFAQSEGLWLLDTAMVYGDSERRLGESDLRGWKVVSKIPIMPEGIGDFGQWVHDSVRASLARLKIQSLYGLLVHRPQQLLDAAGPALYAALMRLKGDRLVEKIGISIYDPAELDQLCTRYRFDIVQCPFNILDRRLIDSGWLYRLPDQGTELHVRSIFLQGLLLMEPETRPSKFSRWDDLWSTWQRWLRQAAVTPLQGCLNFALSFPEVDHVVLGVDNLSQMREIIGALGCPLPHTPRDLQSADPRLINPSNWNAL